MTRPSVTVAMIVTSCASFAALAPVGQANPAVTFNRDVAPIVHAHCAACHRERETAPFALLTYDDVRKRANQIAEVTAERIMPPWKAEPMPGHAPFLGERRLSDEQIGVL